MPLIPHSTNFVNKRHFLPKTLLNRRSAPVRSKGGLADKPLGHTHEQNVTGSRQIIEQNVTGSRQIIEQNVTGSRQIIVPYVDDEMLNIC